MRYLIYGAGAVGGTIAARLALAGRDVVAVARGDHLRVLQRAGLRFVTEDQESVVALRAVGTAAEAAPRADDVVLLCVKSQNTSAALTEIAACAPAEVAVGCVQNGVDNEREALRRFPRAYGVVIFLPAVHLEPGVVEAGRGPVHGVLDIGRAPEGSDATAAAIAADLSASGFASRALEDVMAWKRAKLLRNLWNALDALLGDAAGAADDLRTRAMTEALDCFAAARLSVATGDEVDERIAVMSSAPASLVSSSRQSLARGAGSIETDYLNGEIALLGRLHGVRTPVNAALQQLANRAAADRAPPGALTRADIDAAMAAQL
jgi:2-dehydropantoate 2-reductase